MKRVCRNTVASPCGAQGSGRSQEVLPLVQLPEEDAMKWGDMETDGRVWEAPEGCSGRETKGWRWHAGIRVSLGL